MIINFITTNKHKVDEARVALRPYGIEVAQLDVNYEESHDASMTEIVREASSQLANKLNKTVVVEDTGLFFNAWPGFPGALPKFVWQTIGYKGIFKLLAGSTREAYFKTVLAWCAPGQQPKVFSATMRGVITRKVYHRNLAVMPYDRIFIPAGERVTISDMTLEKKNSFSQRGKVFRKLGKWLLLNNLKSPLRGPLGRSWINPH